jgi:hypothetical protein
MPPAAGRQVRILAAVKQRRQRPKPKYQDQQYGEAAPHLKVMLAEKRSH